MCTGDNIDTASAISRDAGILRTDKTMTKFSALEGKTFREEVGIKKDMGEGKAPQITLNVQKFKKARMAYDLCVLARSSP